jgi:hypothetical protein
MMKISLRRCSGSLLVGGESDGGERDARPAGDVAHHVVGQGVRHAPDHAVRAAVGLGHDHVAAADVVEPALEHQLAGLVAHVAEQHQLVAQRGKRRQVALDVAGERLEPERLRSLEVEIAGGLQVVAQGLLELALDRGAAGRRHAAGRESGNRQPHLGPLAADELEVDRLTRRAGLAGRCGGRARRAGGRRRRGRGRLLGGEVGEGRRRQQDDAGGHSKELGSGLHGTST